MVRRQDVFERPDDPNWTTRGRRIQHRGQQTSNTYVLTYGVTGTGDTPDPGDTPAEQPEQPSDRVTPIPGLPTIFPVEGQGVDVGSQHDNVTGVPDGLAAAPAIEPRKVVLDPAQCDTWDHDPTGPELRDVIAQAFGDDAEVEVIPHPTYATARGRVIDLEMCLVDDMYLALDQLERHTCINGPCQPCRRHQGPAGADARCPHCQTCKRHSPRRRSR